MYIFLTPGQMSACIVTFVIKQWLQRSALSVTIITPQYNNNNISKFVEFADCFQEMILKYALTNHSIRMIIKVITGMLETYLAERHPFQIIENPEVIEKVRAIYNIQMATLFSSNSGSMYVYGMSRLSFLVLMAKLSISSSP